ncbi:hypothetical protein FXO37_33315 [Capsicum annuum]|nr:hypothetical protein FXO37_33315 [Capsicum annuum]
MAYNIVAEVDKIAIRTSLELSRQAYRGEVSDIFSSSNSIRTVQSLCDPEVSFTLLLRKPLHKPINFPLNIFVLLPKMKSGSLFLFLLFGLVWFCFRPLTIRQSVAKIGSFLPFPVIYTFFPKAFSILVETIHFFCCKAENPEKLLLECLIHMLIALGSFEPVAGVASTLPPHMFSRSHVKHSTLVFVSAADILQSLAKIGSFVAKVADSMWWKFLKDSKLMGNMEGLKKDWPWRTILETIAPPRASCLTWIPTPKLVDCPKSYILIVQSGVAPGTSKPCIRLWSCLVLLAALDILQPLAKFGSFPPISPSLTTFFSMYVLTVWETHTLVLFQAENPGKLLIQWSVPYPSFLPKYDHRPV